MNIVIKGNWLKVRDGSQTLVILSVLFFALVTAMAIIKYSWIYLAIVLAPLLIYFSIKKPFIFPFGFYAFLLPFDSIFVIGQETSGATITKFLGIASIFALSISGMMEKKIQRPNNAVIWWGLFVGFGILSIAWAINPELMYERIPTAMGLFLLYLVVSSYKITENDFEIIRRLIIYGGICAAIYAIILYWFWDVSYHEITQRASMIYGERETDPNQFAFSLLIPFALSISAMILLKGKIRKLLDWGFLGIISYAILITGSRGALLGMTAIVLTFLFNKYRANYLLMAIIVLLSIIINYLPEIFFIRISEAYKTGGAGRFDIWIVGFEAFKHYWDLGAGLDNFSMAYNEFRNVAAFHGYSRGAHNIYIGFAVELGIIGFLIMLISIYNHFTLLRNNSDKHKSDSVVLKASLFGLLVSAFFLDVVWRKSFWLLWMMIMMYNTLMKKKISK